MAKSDLQRFFDYARAFELAFLADAWEGLEPFFSADARHVVRGGGPFEVDNRGRGALVGGLRRSVLDLDRRFDARIPEIIEGPQCRPEGIWMRYRLTLRRGGLPDLAFEGEHLARYEAGLIHALEERIEPSAGALIAAYLAEHDAALRPAACSFAPPSAVHDQRDLKLATLRTLARCYGGAKSHQDIGAALAVCSDDFLLETVSLGVAAHGRIEAEQQLAIFFTAFPDYRVEVEGMAAEGTSVACWGRALLTFAGPLLGHAPTGRAADLPFVSIFTCRDGALTGEKFVFDLATLCDQTGLPLAGLMEAARPLRAARAAPAAAEVLRRSA